LALGRRSLEATQVRWDRGVCRVEWNESITLDRELFNGTPLEDIPAYLAERLKPWVEKIQGNYFSLQVALPDPAAKAEVFGLVQMPKGPEALKDYLSWRFKREEETPLAFTSYFQGEAEGSYLLLGECFEERWLTAIQKTFQLCGVQASVIDTACSYRFNFFHDVFAEKKAGGALVALEEDYWNLILWDEFIRPRLILSKWWPQGSRKLKDLPLEETVLEVERTIRSYVYSGKDRSVENLFLAAPKEWMPEILKEFNRRAEGNCIGLSRETRIKQNHAKEGGWSPSAWVAAVER
jgi:hypothetical protein